jgi:hypothetical protein
MTFAQPSRLGTKRRILSLCLAWGLAVAALGAADPGEAAGPAVVPSLAAHSGLVLTQAGPEADKATKPDKSKKTKRRAVRCGGPGLPECPKM